MCAQHAHVTIATVVDHIRPHKGDPRLFWNSTNLQSLCKKHHDGSKQKQEHVGYVIGCDAQGNPIDPRHHWRNE
jgi:5-methylcytosine-specific restriction enzyme A